MSGTVEELETREQELVTVLNGKSSEIDTMNAELIILNDTNQTQATQIKVCGTHLSKYKPEALPRLGAQFGLTVSSWYVYVTRWCS